MFFFLLQHSTTLKLLDINIKHIYDIMLMPSAILCHGYGDAPKSFFTPCRFGPVTWPVPWLQPVNQIVETWKSFDCGHSWEAVWPGPKHRHNAQIWTSYFAVNRHQFCLSGDLNHSEKQFLTLVRTELRSVLGLNCCKRLIVLAKCWITPSFWASQCVRV